MRESSVLPRHHLRRIYCKLPADSILPALNYKWLLFKFEPTCGGHCAKVPPPFSAHIPLVLRALCKNWVCIYSGCHAVSLNHQCLEKVLNPDGFSTSICLGRERSVTKWHVNRGRVVCAPHTAHHFLPVRTLLPQDEKRMNQSCCLLHVL